MQDQETIETRSIAEDP